MMIHHRGWCYRTLKSLVHSAALPTLVVASMIGLTATNRTLAQATGDQKNPASKESAKKNSTDARSDVKPASATGKAVDPFADEPADTKAADAKASSKTTTKTDDKASAKTDDKPSSAKPPANPTPDSKSDKTNDDPFANPPAKKADPKPATDPFADLLKDAKATTKPDKHSKNPFEENDAGQTGDAKTPADIKPGPDAKPLPDGKTPDATAPRSPGDLLKDTPSTEPEPTPGGPELKKGQGLIDAGKYADAIAPLKEAIKKAPTDAGPGTADSAHLYLGIAYRMLNRFDDAIEEFSEALKLNPELGDAFFRRGICWYYKDEYPLAQADFEDASATTNTDRDRTRPLTWKGMTLVKQGQIRDAVNVYSEALRYDNAYASAHVNRGLAYLSLKEYPKAIADFDQAIRSTPKDATLYFKRGVAQAGAGDWAAAVKSYGEAIRLNPRYADAYTNRSAAYQRLGDTAKSQADAERSSQLKADAARARQSAAR